MKKFLPFIFLIFSFLSFLNLSPNLVFSATQGNGIEVNLGVEGCNANGICELNENLLTCPVDCTPPPSSSTTTGSKGSVPNISNVMVAPDFTNSFISWQSSVGTMSTVKWGQTVETKEGAIRSYSFALNHRMEIINLKPGTMYYFTIESEDAKGKTHVFGPSFFFTKFLKDTTYPLSPRSSTISASPSGISLSWENPPDENFSYVRIMRHDDRFSGDPFTGKLIYEGTAETFLDANVVPGKKYFYVIFSRDNTGTFSSGTGLSITAFSDKEIAPEQIPPTTVPTEETPPTLVPPVETPPQITPLPLIFRPQTFFIYQYNETVEPLTNEKILTIQSSQSTIIDTDIKTRSDDWIEVINEDGKVVGRYLFLFNSDSNRFQSVIPPFEKSGKYTVKIYRYLDNAPMVISQGTLLVEQDFLPEVGNVYKKIPKGSWTVLFWLILLLFLLPLLLRRRRKNQQK